MLCLSVLHVAHQGEGFTPLVFTPRLAEAVGLPSLSVYVKDESRNPSSSFKARGLCMAVRILLFSIRCLIEFFFRSPKPKKWE